MANVRPGLGHYQKTMNCPYCRTFVPGLTGLQEADNFRKHLNRCKKAPQNMISDGQKTVHLGRKFDLQDALKIRAESGQ